MINIKQTYPSHDLLECLLSLIGFIFLVFHLVSGTYIRAPTKFGFAPGMGVKLLLLLEPCTFFFGEKNIYFFWKKESPALMYIYM